MKKKLYTREEFEEFRQDAALRMVTDGELFKESLKLLNRADSYHWIHQTTWFGQPVLNLAQDMFAIQEIIFETRPKYVIEVAKKIAEIKGLTYQEVADITTRNFFECFHISE